MDRPTTSSNPPPMSPELERYMNKFLTSSRPPPPRIEPLGNKRTVPDNFQDQQASKKRLNMAAGDSTAGKQSGVIQQMRKAHEVPVTKPPVGHGQMIKNLGQANPYQGGGNVYHIMNDPNIKNNRPQDEFYTGGFTTINAPLHKMNKQFVPYYSGEHADFQDNQYGDGDGFGDEETEEEEENMVEKPKQQPIMGTKHKVFHEMMVPMSQNTPEMKAFKSETSPETKAFNSETSSEIKVSKSKTALENKATKSKTVLENEGAKSKAVPKDKSAKSKTVKEKKDIPTKRYNYKPVDNVFIREERTPIENSLDDGIMFIFGTDDLIAMARWIINNRAWRITGKEMEFGNLLDQLGFTRDDLDIKIKKSLRTKTSAKLATLHGWMLKSGAMVHPDDDEKIVVFAPWIGEWMKPTWDGNMAIPAGVDAVPPPVRDRNGSYKAIMKSIAEENEK